MELRITGRHAKLNAEVRAYAEEKLATLERFDQRMRVLDVVLDHEPRATLAEAKAHVGRGAPIVVHAKHATAEGAIDLIHDKLEGALNRKKERTRDLHRQPPGEAVPKRAALPGAESPGER